MNGQDLGDVQASLAQAADAQIARVVAMVDALPDRGDADALIAPLRPRLAQLRPVRAVGFTRLLFTPVNPVIVPTLEWRRSGLGVPRPALQLLGEAIRAALPEGAAWRAEIHPESGPILWPMAATILDGLGMPADWAATGLATREYSAVAGIAAALLHEATLIDMRASRRRPADDATIRAILHRCKARKAAALDTAVAVLLAQLPSPGRVLPLAAEVANDDLIIGRALDQVVANLSRAAAGTSDLRGTAAEAGRIALLLGSLEKSATPGRRNRLDSIRRKADASCRRCFDGAFSETMALVKTGAAAPFDDGSVAAIEARARDLRSFEGAARKLGSATYYDTLLADAALTIRKAPGPLGLADQVRLVEILAGPEQALAMLSASQAPEGASAAPILHNPSLQG